MLLVIASCSAEGSQEAASEPVAEPAGEMAPAPSAEEQPDTTSASSSEDPPSPAAAPERSAPDFTLELGGGGTFVLSEQTTPVLIIFWAEW